MKLLSKLIIFLIATTIMGAAPVMAQTTTTWTSPTTTPHTTRSDDIGADCGPVDGQPNQSCDSPTGIRPKDPSKSIMNNPAVPEQVRNCSTTTYLAVNGEVEPYPVCFDLPCADDEVYLIDQRVEDNVVVAEVRACVRTFDPETTRVDPPFAPDKQCPEGLICRPCEFKGQFFTLGTWDDRPLRLHPDYLCVPDTYVVKPGDTLWGIAARYLGSGFYWTQLCSEHSDDPRRLQIGSVVGFC